jgi:hypothetical protein
MEDHLAGEKPFRVIPTRKMLSEQRFHHGSGFTPRGRVGTARGNGWEEGDRIIFANVVSRGKKICSGLLASLVSNLWVWLENADRHELIQRARSQAKVFNE